jgi:hypothetical protein
MWDGIGCSGSGGGKGLADDFMAGINERNNAPYLRRDTAETFAALVEMYREKIAPHLKNSTRMNYNFFLKTYLIPELGENKACQTALSRFGGFLQRPEAGSKKPSGTCTPVSVPC